MKRIIETIYLLFLKIICIPICIMIEFVSLFGERISSDLIFLFREIHYKPLNSNSNFNMYNSKDKKILLTKKMIQDTINFMRNKKNKSVAINTYTDVIDKETVISFINGINNKCEHNIKKPEDLSIAQKISCQITNIYLLEFIKIFRKGAYKVVMKKREKIYLKIYFE